MGRMISDNFYLTMFNNFPLIFTIAISFCLFITIVTAIISYNIGERKLKEEKEQ